VLSGAARAVRRFDVEFLRFLVEQDDDCPDGVVMPRERREHFVQRGLQVERA